MRYPERGGHVHSWLKVCVARVLDREAGKEDMFSLLLGGRNVFFASEDPLIGWWRPDP